jgi:dynein heavy chain
VGNTLRLVITPLTDRCIITLTQALNLVMGGAPAGPAGTGKTETTKDLGRAIGIPVMVFNCSDQMNKDSMAQIFMGLCQSGAWGCFDEFNRISIEVLSVVSTQVKTCLDAQKEKKKKFIFLEEGEINLEDTSGYFITMNPGYTGRTELPDNLKALFRSCAMVVPDLVLICENMLMSEGFVLARDLSKKFVALYQLSSALLSKQRHYDWGLRAVKSVLRQAGKLKRDPENEKINEDPLLKRALRDFNLPKIVTDDKPIFIRLIEDLFPQSKTEKKVASQLTKLCEQTTKNDMGLYLEEQFVNKCIDLSDILDVRHCMFIIGPPGCGKTTVWRTLLKTNKNNGEDGEYDTLNPKAVTSNELFGCYTKSKEWRNGVLSMIMKNQNKCEEKYKKSHVHKWTILDGDVDPEWIESLNTVMDDNKVLTLVSNDRIPLTADMRLIFEISNLKHANPSTVSRGGVLFVNETDIGWQPFVNSWLDRSQPYMRMADDGLSLQYPMINDVAKAVFFRCFQSYIETPSDMMDQTKITYLAPPVTMGFIQTICMILDGLLGEHEKQINSGYGSKEKEEELKIIYEGFFIFATMWAYGGSVGGGQDDNEVLNKFNGVFRSLVKVKFPEGGLVYDYYYNVEENKWSNWGDVTPAYEHVDEPLFSKIFVPTIHTTRLRYLLDMHLKRRKPVLFVGGAGTGKTQVIKDYLSSTKPDQVSYKTINFSSFTDSLALQQNIESMLDRKSGRTYGSAMNKVLIAFIDDLNMPYVDTYGTQSPIQLMRQIVDFGSVFNREQLEERKFIQDLLFFSCLNHKSGSFTIDLRLQRNFSCFTMYTPTDEIIRRIFGEILKAHLGSPGFEEKLKPFSDKIMDATVMFFTKTIRNPQFSPSAKKFHYQFNFRELAKIIEGVMRSTPQHFKIPNQITRIWYHEVKRVFEDRFINNDDLNLFQSILKEAISKNIGDWNEKDTPLAEPVIYTSFIGEFYTPVEEMIDLRKTMKEKLEDYNDVKAQMNLVLFDQAIEHVCHISRIIELPSGNALLVGVGGSGKQSLARLATFILGYELEQMMVTQSFNMNDLRNYLSEMYRKIVKPNASTRVYMITDSQIKT